MNGAGMYYWPPMGEARSFGPVQPQQVAIHLRLAALPTGRRRHLRLVK